MKKKLLIFLFTICLIIPCVFMLSACGKDPDDQSPKNAVAVTIEFAFNDDHYRSFTESEYWEVDEITKTFKTTYLNGFAWEGYLFDVVATTKNGDTRNLYEATESNPMGYKIDTNMPETDGRLPVGTYTFKLYCENFNNGQYKVEACESETYTVIIEKESIRLEDYEWQLSNSNNEYTGDSMSVSLNPHAYWGTSSIDLEMAGITNFRVLDDATSTLTASNVGEYTARAEYDADTTNFDYGNKLPQKTFNWSIKKKDLSAEVENIWDGFEDEDFSIQYNDGNEIVLLYDASYLNQYIQWYEHIIKITGFKVNGTPIDGEKVSVTGVGEYLIQPIFTQYDNENYEIIDADDPKYSRTFTITKKQFKATDFYWSGNIIPYTGWPQQVFFEYPSGAQYLNIQTVIDLDNNITAEATNAGTYIAKVTIDYDEDLYEIIDGTIPLEYEWTIEKAELEKTVSWYLDGDTNKVQTIYNGLDRSPVVSIQNCTTVVKHYDSEGTELTGDIINVGKYKSVITEISGYDKNNYELKLIGSLEFEWQINYSCEGVWDIVISDGNYTSEYTGSTDIATEVLPNGKITVDFNENCVTPNADFTFKFSLDGGNTFVEEIDIELDASIPTTYVITVVVESTNPKLLEFIDSNLLTLTIIIH